MSQEKTRNGCMEDTSHQPGGDEECFSIVFVRVTRHLVEFSVIICSLAKV